jgi:hypothetical protein
MTDNELSSALRTLTEAIYEVDRLALATRQADEPLPRELIADAVTAVHQGRDILKGTFDTLCQVLDPLMGEEAEIRSPGGTLIEKKWSKPRKAWRHQELASVVAHRIRNLSVDPDTGEVLLSPEEQIAELIRYAAPSYWRVKELKTLGIDADGYCEVGESTPSIVVRQNA